MQIKPYSQSFNTNFKAIKTAQVQSRIAHKPVMIDLYKLTKKDKPFLTKLLQKTSLKTLCPKIAEYACKRWQSIFDYCIDCALKDDFTTYIAISENKPCGILTYINDKTAILEGICAIPDKSGKKVPFSGLALFYQLFRENQANKIECIELDAVTDGPFDVIKKYEQLGFKQEGFVDKYIKMRCSKYKIKDQLQKLPTILDYTQTNPVETDLNSLLD